MAWVFFHESVKEGKLFSPLEEAAALLAEPPPPPPAPIDSFGSRITPNLLLIIVIIAIIFFVCGLLHLLRYLLKSPAAARGAEPTDAAAGGGVTVFQGQLRQLFHLHDAGVDQSFIDALPVFHYKSIVGAAKDPFDCAVCLCEFEAEDELRLLPKCSHAFHLECIDTWLLSHSTCPLCRRCLLSDFSPAASGCGSAVVLVLESGRSEQSLRESASEMGESIRNLNFNLCAGEDDMMSIITENQDETVGKEEVSEAAETKVVTIKLGKFRSTADAAGGGGQAQANAGGGGQAQANAGGNGGLDQRRCLSMGSYEYVMEESALLRVAINATRKKPALKKMSCSRVAMSECDCHSRRNLNFRVDDPNASASTSLRKKESFSVSKIWMQSRKDEPTIAGEPAAASSRRAFSFRLPLRRAGREEPRQKKRPASEIDDVRWCKSGSELDLDVEDGSCNKRVDATPSFARTIVSLLGRQNRVGDHA